MAVATVEIVTCRLETPDRKQNGQRLLVRGPEGKLIDACATPFDSLDGDIDFREYFGWGVPVMVPIVLTEEPYQPAYLFGRQTRRQYEPWKRRITEVKIGNCGIICLKENPIPAVLVPYKYGTSRIVSYEGHHRGRYAPKFGIKAAPSVVYAPETMAEILNRRKFRDPLNPFSSHVDAKEVINVLNYQVEAALESFREPTTLNGLPKEHGLPLRKEPHPVQTRSINDLARMFSSFSIPSRVAEQNGFLMERTYGKKSIW